jgi:polyvinyl alcohol dehydrogenase (cytochrome)
LVFVPAASWEETRSGNPKYACCTFRGSVSALRVSDGSPVRKKVVWSQQVTGGDFSSGGACADQDTKCGPDSDFGASAILLHFGGRDLLIAGEKSGVVYALDPGQCGKIVWQARVGKGGMAGGVQWGLASDEQNVYASVSDLVDLPDNAEGGGDSAPIGGANFDPVAGGGLTALKLTDGN